jgi:hypothetical protein
MLTPHEFFTRFKAIGGADAQQFFQRLPEEQIGWLIEDDAWGLCEHWMHSQRLDGFTDPIQHDMKVPELVCHECAEYTRPDESDPYCMNRQKPIPTRILTTGCNDWRPQ